MEAEMPERIRLVLKWLMVNKELMLMSDIVKLKLDIKGRSVHGEVTIVPDNYK